MRELLRRIEEIRRNLEELKALLEALSVDCHAYGLPSFIANMVWKLKIKAEHFEAEILAGLSHIEGLICARACELIRGQGKGEI